MKLKEFSEQYPDVEITEEQEEQIKKYLNIKKNKKWKPNHNDDYFYIHSQSIIGCTIFLKNNEVDKYRLLTNNCFKTREEAEFRLEQIKVYYELKNFADEHNDKIDWNDEKIKYCICNKYTDETASHRYIGINRACYVQSIGGIYFSSEKLAQQAMAKVGIDRIQKYLFE